MLTPETYWRFPRQFSAALQEFIEAKSFFVWMTERRLVRLEEVENNITRMLETSKVPCGCVITVENFLLGIADLAGELMRVATAACGDGNVTLVTEVEVFLQQLEERK